MAEKDDAAQIAAAKDGGIRFIQLQFTDIIGLVKAVTIPIHQLEGSVRHGTWFDGSSVEGFTRIAESDQYLMPDMSTFAEIPWRTGPGRAHRPRHLRRVHAPGEPFVGDPRGSCAARSSGRRSLATSSIPGRSSSSSSSGARRTAIEPLPHDQAGYFDFSTDLAQEVRKDMVDALEAFGIRVEAAHHEVAVGQHEIDFEYGDALHTADHAITFKTRSRPRPAARPLRDVYAQADPRYQRLGHAHPPVTLLDRRQEERLRRRVDPYGLVAR